MTATNTTISGVEDLEGFMLPGDWATCFKLDQIRKPNHLVAVAMSTNEPITDPDFIHTANVRIVSEYITAINPGAITWDRFDHIGVAFDNVPAVDVEGMTYYLMPVGMIEELATVLLRHAQALREGGTIESVTS